MTNFEHTDNIGSWFFHSLITSAKLVTMAQNEEAVHQNKPRTCHQFESTFEIAGENEGQFIEISHLQPEHTVLVFGVHILDSDNFSGPVASTSWLFPDAPGIGPFLRPVVIVHSMSSFAIPNASGGDDWQTATLGGATDQSDKEEWPLAALGMPIPSSGVDNFKEGIVMQYRIAGFDGQNADPVPANSNYYNFWHGFGPIAAYT